MSTIQVNLDDIPAIQLTESQRIVYQKIVPIASYFFMKASGNAVRPMRGFLLEGPPASGKTEVVLQVAKTLQSKLARNNPPYTLRFHFVDSSAIAAPHWGEAEKRLAREFPTGAGDNEKHVVLVDDIDCLLITRGSEIAKEWHYSINSVIFHRLDFMDPTKSIVIATTNKPELVDDALRSRLYALQVPLPTLDEVYMIVQQMAKNLGIGDQAEDVASLVAKKMKSEGNPTLRRAQHLLIEACIESGVWRVSN